VTTAVPRLGPDVLDDLDRRLAPADADLAARSPGDEAPDGRHVVRDGRLLGADMDTLRRDLARRARRLWPEDAR
jgi:hypothetical protein